MKVKIANVNPATSMIPLNVTASNIPVIRQRLSN